jgi:anti-sigma regulatory factor (Ser/Thr protein kinase)
VIEEVPNAAVAELLPGRPSDDVAVMTVGARRAGQPALALQLAPVETSVAIARRAATEALHQWDVPESAHSDVILLVSELVTNTLQHGSPPIEMRMRLQGRCLVLDVSDGGLPQPVVRELDPSATGGRGLHLIAALARTWGTRPTGNGKSVWCVVDI